MSRTPASGSGREQEDSGLHIRVLIADDHPIVRQGLVNLLEVQPGIRVLGAAESGEQALTMAQTDPPDVVLMDLMMPGIDGVETTRRMLELCPQARVIVLTSHHEDAMVFPAISAGALSYLLKSAAPNELIDAVRAAARGEARLSPRVAGRLMQEVSGRGPSADALTARELEVLRLIARGQDNATIAEALGLSPKTVKTHVSNVLGKLGVADRTAAAVMALRQGIVPLEEG